MAKCASGDPKVVISNNDARFLQTSLQLSVLPADIVIRRDHHDGLEALQKGVEGLAAPPLFPGPKVNLANRNE